MDNQEWHFHSYRSIMKIRRVIYRLGDMQLPKGVSVDQLAVGALAFVLIFVLWGVFPFLDFFLNRTAALLVGTVAAMFGLTNLDVQGKSAMGFFLSVMVWAVRPKKIRRWQRVILPWPYKQLKKPVVFAKLWFVNQGRTFGYAFNDTFFTGQRIFEVQWSTAAKFWVRFGLNDAKGVVTLWKKPNPKQLKKRETESFYSFRTPTHFKWKEGQ